MARSVIRCVSKLNLKPRHLSCTPQNADIKTAGIIVIGDEILKGEVVDTNSSYMTSRLHNLGVKVKKISVIGDVLEEISDEVKLFSDLYTYVITTGGIGPTHDDITFEAVAQAFNDTTFLHPELVKLCTRFYNTSDPCSPGMKLARVPKTSKLTFLENPKLNYPNVSVRNVYMFPGIPQLFQKSFDLLSPTLFPSSCRFYSKCVYINVTEDQIAQALESVVQTFPDVMVGSYPELCHSNYKVRITIESTKEQSTTDAYNKLLEIVPQDSIVRK